MRDVLGEIAAYKAEEIRAAMAFVSAEDIKELAPLVLPHRMILSPEAELQGLRALELLDRALEEIPVPRERIES